MNIDDPKFSVESKAVVDHDDSSPTDNFKPDINLNDIEDDIIPSRHRTSKRNRVSKRVRRNARVHHNHDFKWPGGVVPYTIDSSLTAYQLNIRLAMKYISCGSCIKFVERKNEVDFVRIYNDNTPGCRSNIGREGGQQILKLTRGCASNQGTITHELMHTLGFYHEHNRPDRDTYIKINWSNIKPSKKNNFYKKSPEDIDTLNTQYDFFSIMHYDWKAFSKNNQDTIETLIKVFALLPYGSHPSNEASTTDLLRINRLYKCPPKDISSTALMLCHWWW